MVRHYAPPSSASRESLFALSSANRYRWRVIDRPLPPWSTPEQEADSMARKEEMGSSHASSSLPSRPAISVTSSQSEFTTADKEHTQLLGSTGSQEHVITAPIIGGVVPDKLGLVVSSEEKEMTPPHLPPSSPELAGNQEVEGTKHLDKERFPMGCCVATPYEQGWLDIACGPAITIDVEYTSHNHEPSPGDHTPLLPNALRVDIDAPVVLIRVFGSLARDLLGLKVS